MACPGTKSHRRDSLTPMAVWCDRSLQYEDGHAPEMDPRGRTEEAVAVRERNGAYGTERQGGDGKSGKKQLLSNLRHDATGSSSAGL